jgi:hypothetical protein
VSAHRLAATAKQRIEQEALSNQRAATAQRARAESAALDADAQRAGALADAAFERQQARQESTARREVEAANKATDRQRERAQERDDARRGVDREEDRRQRREDAVARRDEHNIYAREQLLQYHRAIHTSAPWPGLPHDNPDARRLSAGADAIASFFSAGAAAAAAPSDDEGNAQSDEDEDEEAHPHRLYLEPGRGADMA